MIFLSCLVFAITIHNISGRSENLPDYMTPCDYNDKNLEECIKKEMDKAIPHFAKNGIPEYGLESLDPLKLDDIILDANHLKMSFFDPVLIGLSSIKLTEFKLDARDLSAEFVMGFVGDMKLISNYKMNGSILILPIQGEGPATIFVHDLAVHLTCNVVHIKDRENHRHMKLKAPVYTYKIGSTKFKLENLFNGNKELSDTTHDFANSNAEQLMDELAPPAVKQISTAIVKCLNDFLSKIDLTKMMKNVPAE